MIALAITVLSFVGVEAHAQCMNNPAMTNCTVQDCQARQALVHPACDVPRSCANIQPTRANLADLQNRLGLNQACLTARLNVGACYNVADPGHQQQEANVQSAIAMCQQQIGAVPPPPP
jgi:hypothetical protein